MSHVIVRHPTGDVHMAVRATHPNVIVNGGNRSMRGLHGIMTSVTNIPTRVGVTRIHGPRLSTGLITSDVASRLRHHIVFHHTVGHTMRGTVHLNTGNVGIRIDNHLNNTRVTHAR